MYRLNRYFSWISVLIIALILLSACATPAQQTTAPQQTTEPEVSATEAPAEAPTVGIFLPDKKTMRYDTKDRPIFTENNEGNLS